MQWLIQFRIEDYDQLLIEDATLKVKYFNETSAPLPPAIPYNSNAFLVGYNTDAEWCINRIYSKAWKSLYNLKLDSHWLIDIFIYLNTKSVYVYNYMYLYTYAW